MSANRDEYYNIFLLLKNCPIIASNINAAAIRKSRIDRMIIQNPIKFILTK